MNCQNLWLWDYYLLRHDHVVVLRSVNGLRSGLWPAIVEQGIVVVHHDELCILFVDSRFERGFLMLSGWE